MLTERENELLTNVNSGTPTGNLLRKYWHPLLPSIELSKGETRRVRLLGENLVLFRLDNGTLGIMEEQCPHRRASLAYGFLEEDGIRCAYHGWKFDVKGTCVDQPFEPKSSNFRDRVKQKAYNITDFCGLLWIYMGPEPAPLLPTFNLFKIKSGLRWIIYADVNANWLQLLENAHDGQHVYYLHGQMMKKRLGLDLQFSRRPESIDFVRYEWGIIPKRVYRDDYGIAVKEKGHPIVFPNLNYALPSPSGITCNFFIPLDNKKSRFLSIQFLPEKNGNELKQEKIPAVDVTPFVKGENEYFLDNVLGTDMMAWETQGEVLDRTKEHLGASDRGVAMIRQILKEEIKKVEEGNDPIAIQRDQIMEPEALNIANTLTDFSLHTKINGELQDRTFRAIKEGKIPEEVFGVAGRVRTINNVT